jgi:pyrroloquinoline quinone biosynthesis protein B
MGSERPQPLGQHRSLGPGYVSLPLAFVLGLLVTQSALAKPVDKGARVRVLGIAQDGGLPHAACRCSRCETARNDPTRRSGVASLGIIAPAAKKVYLIDATPDIRDQLALLQDVRLAPKGKVDRDPIDGVLLTHAHMGHYLGLAHLGFEAVSTKGVPVWASERMGNFLRQNGPWDQLVKLENILIKRATPGQPILLSDGIRVIPIEVPHRSEYTDTLAYRIEGPSKRILYIPDTSPWEKWEKPMERSLEGIDIALLDATFFSGAELPGRDLTKIGHPLIRDTMRRLEGRLKAGKLEVYFIHLNHSNPALDPKSEAAAEIERRGFHVARVGQEFSL